MGPVLEASWSPHWPRSRQRQGHRPLPGLAVRSRAGRILFPGYGARRDVGFFILPFPFSTYPDIDPCSAASETENPRRNISKAVRRVFWRIVIFYILGILITGMLVPYDDPDLLNGVGTASESPYVIAIRRAGIRTLPSIINAAIFSSAFSAGNSFLFCSSRILYGLAIRGQAPRIFTYCTSKGLPIVAVLFCVSFGASVCTAAY